ncbi:MAG: hypothetical protein VCA55_01050, partial [Verrucomicrobiales bacterium]
MVVNQAGFLGAKLIAEAGDTDADRVRWAYRRVLQRNPSGKELSRGIEFVKNTRSSLSPGKPKTDAQTLSWVTLCQALLASNEFRYID